LILYFIAFHAERDENKKISRELEICGRKTDSLNQIIHDSIYKKNDFNK
jgi:hypothetical protein